MPVRTIAILFCALVAVPASGASSLVAFAEANGCKLRADQRTVKRLQEFAAQGTVVWEGACKGGLIEGKGVLRQEGTLTADGRTKKYAYLLSGPARKGVREGRWTRETFERFADSAKFYTSASALNYVNGVAKGKPELQKITALDQLTPAFRQLVIDAQRDAKPANEALLAAAAPVAASKAAPPAAVVPAPTEVPATAPEPPAVARPAVASPVTAPVEPPKAAPSIASKPPAAAAKPAPAPRFTASSQYRHYGPEGLLAATSPGWHSASPPDYPEWIMVDFQATREILKLGLLAQDKSWERAPKAIRVESSDDGKAWDAQIASEIPCQPNGDDGWLHLMLRRAAKGRYLRIVILQNCGEPAFVTLRGLRFD